MNLIIPAIHRELFVGGIVHPELFLWDSWSYQERDETHLYCLAVSRVDRDKQPIDPLKRNDYPFHVRHFLSIDQGESWRDLGCSQKPPIDQGLFDSKSIWSGSVTLLEDGRKLVAHTGLREAGSELQFQQSMAVAISNDGHTVVDAPTQALSCALRDYSQITEAGYYLGELKELGHKAGESGGPILAWRDPFALLHEGKIHLFWCAKAASNVAALAHGIIAQNEHGFTLLELFEPVRVPDDDEFTQLELPKVLYDKINQLFYLIVATCDRLYEGQPDAEVNRTVRLYKSSSLRGPWLPAGKNASNNSSIVCGPESCMYGLTVLSADFETGQLRCIAPFTESAKNGKALSLSDVFTLSVN